MLLGLPLSTSDLYISCACLDSNVNGTLVALSRSVVGIRVLAQR